MSLMTGISVDTFVQYGGVTGTASASQMNQALQLSWSRIESAIGTYLYPTVVTEERHHWPANGRIMLDKTYLNSIISVTTKRDVGNVNCELREYTGCAIIIDADLSIITIREGGGSSSPCACGGHEDGPAVVMVTYIAGIPQPLSDDVKLAITLLAKDFLSVLTSGSDDEFTNLQPVTSWSSLGYSESRGGKVKGNPFSLPSRAEMAFSLIESFKKKRSVALVSNPRSGRVG